MPALPAPTDPRLEAFWQQAQALMALEQGLTATFQVKLATLAQELQLSDDEFQQGLARLRSPADPVAPPSPVEQQTVRFREYVERKLGKLASPMLDAVGEERLVAVAAERFQLDAVTARKVIEATATQRGIRRITRDEARQIVAEMVAEKVKDEVWLDHPSAQRLIVAGQVWGLSAAEIDQLIRECTTANRDRIAAERRRNVAVMIAAGAVVVALVAIAVGVYASRRPQPAVSPEGQEIAVDGPAAESATTKKRPTAPDWWDSRLAVAVAQARTWHRSFRGIYELLTSKEPDERGLAYERLVAWSAQLSESDEAERSPAALAREILIGAYVAEPDEAAAARLRAALVGPIKDVCQKGPRRAAEVHLAAWALETVVQMVKLPALSESRLSSVQQELSVSLESRVASGEPVAELRREWSAAFARIVLRHAASRASTDANLALDLHDAIRESAAQLPVEEFQRLQTAVLVAAIPESGEHWNAWRPVLRESLAARDPLLLAPLIELFERGGTSPWREPLGEMLRTRAGTAASVKDPVELARAIRESLGLAAASVKALPVDVWNQLRGPVEEALARLKDDGDPEELLSRAIELSHWGTLAAAAAHGDSGRHVWDLVWREGPPKRSTAGGAARPEVPTFERPELPRTAMSPRILTARRTQVQRLAGALEHFDRLEPIQRLNCVRGLATLVTEVSDVTPAHGQSIAKYLLSSRSEPEAREMQEPGRVIVAWPQVQLGLADHLATSKISAGSLAELLGKALGRTVTEVEAMDGRANLRRELLAHVLDNLSGPALTKDQQAVLGAKASEAATTLYATYLRRASLWGLDASAVTMEPAPGLVVAALTRHVASRQVAAGQLSDLDRRWLAEFSNHAAIADYQSTSDLHRMVAWERLLIRLSVNEMTRLHPEHAADAAALVSRELDGRLTARSLLAQLVQYESLQLRLWMLASTPPRSRT